MFSVDAAVLVYLRRVRSVSQWRAAMLCTLGAGVVLAGVLGGGHFRIFRLVAFGVFLHAVLVLAGAAIVLRNSLPRTAVGSAIACVFILVVALEGFLVEPTWLEVSHVRLVSPKLDQPVRIVVLADLQTDALGSYEKAVFRRVLQEKPDLILLAGDYLQGPRGQQAELRWEFNSFLRRIHFAAPAGVFAVRGNVDGNDWGELFAGLPITAVDTTRSFDVAGLRLTCLSCGDSFHPTLELRSNDPHRFHLALGHCPNFALGAVEADLLLAGHTHGGQVRLPFLGPVMTHCAVPRDWAAGLTELPGGNRLLVSRGVGMERAYAPRLRLLCRPELVVVDLVPE